MIFILSIFSRCGFLGKYWGFLNNRRFLIVDDYLLIFYINACIVGFIIFGQDVLGTESFEIIEKS